MVIVIIIEVSAVSHFIIMYWHAEQQRQIVRTGNFLKSQSLCVINFPVPLGGLWVSGDNNCHFSLSLLIHAFFPLLFLAGLLGRAGSPKVKGNLKGRSKLARKHSKCKGYYTSHAKTMLPTKKSVPRSSRQLDHMKIS